MLSRAIQWGLWVGRAPFLLVGREPSRKVSERHRLILSVNPMEREQVMDEHPVGGSLQSVPGAASRDGKETRMELRRLTLAELSPVSGE